MAQSFGRRLPSNAPRHRFWYSSGPIRSNTNWHCDVLLGYARHSHTSLGTEPLQQTEKRMFTTSTLPAGSDDLFAVYNGDANYASSTSPLIIQVVLAKPGHCDDHYDNWFYGSPDSPNIQGSSGNNFFWVPDGSFDVNGSNGTTASRVATATTLSPAATATTTSPAVTATTRFPSEMATTKSRSATEPTKSLSAAATTRDRRKRQAATTSPWATGMTHSPLATVPPTRWTWVQAPTS